MRPVRHGRSVCKMEMLELRDLHKTFNPGTVNEKVEHNLLQYHSHYQFPNE